MLNIASDIVTRLERKYDTDHNFRDALRQEGGIRAETDNAVRGFTKYC